MAGTPWFGSCGNCGDEGQLLAVALRSSGDLRLMCDECESQFASTTPMSDDELPHQPVRLATKDEWEAAGWEPEGYLDRDLSF